MHIMIASIVSEVGFELIHKVHFVIVLKNPLLEM